MSGQVVGDVHVPKRPRTIHIGRERGHYIVIRLEEAVMTEGAQEPGSAKFPAKSVAADGADLGLPTANLLRSLGMLPTEGEVAGPSAAIRGTPDSVVVIEAGATTLSKFWASGGGAVILAGWAAVRIWWSHVDTGVQGTVIWAAAIGTAAIAVGIAYIVGSDVRGRAAATVATLEARGRVAQAMIRESARLYMPEPAAATTAQLVPVLPVQVVEWTARYGPDEQGWMASAMRVTGDEVEYRLAKGIENAWVPATEIKFS